MDFEQLYKAYYLKIYSYAFTILKDSHLAEEVTQEVFFKAFKSKSKFKNQSSEYTWLCAIAKNACMDELRREKKNKKIVEHIPDDVPQMKSMYEEEQILRIHQILHTLKEPYKEVFQLRVFGELSFKQIAQIFGKTESWARVTYHRAKMTIQERM